MQETSLTREHIVSAIRNSTAKLRAFGVKSVALFGSFARGDFSPDSDVDILVEFEPDKTTYDNFIETCFYLEKLLNRRVELVTMEGLSPHIKPYVLKEIVYVPLSA
jgi:hypothetical protein